MNNSIKISKGDFCIGLYIFTICFNLIIQTLAGTNIQNILFIPKEVLYSLTPKISLLLFIIIFFINGTVIPYDSPLDDRRHRARCGQGCPLPAGTYGRSRIRYDQQAHAKQQRSC